MSIDAMPLREADHAPASTPLPEKATPATVTEPGPADRVSTPTLISHAVDRAEARLERLRDELYRVRATDQRDDLDVDEIRLLAAVAEAERERDACSSLAAGPLEQDRY